MTLRKFFDTAEGDGGGGSAEATEQTWKVTEFNVADGIPEEEVAATATETEAAADTQITPEPEKETPLTETTEEAASTATVAQPNPPVEWKDAIKTVDKAEVLSLLGEKSEILKALGYDDKVAQMINYFEEHGNLSDYVRETAIDYAAMSDVDVIREQLRRDNPKATGKAFDYLVKVEMAKYDTDPDNVEEEVAEYNKYQLTLKAEEARQKLIDGQQKFLLPTKAPAVKPDETAQVAETETKRVAEEKLAKDKADFDKMITEDPRTRQLLTDKKIRIGGKDGYNFTVDPTDYADYATGKKNFFDLFATADGIDLESFYATLTYAKNRAAMDSDSIGHGKTQAFKEDASGGSAAGERGQGGSAMKQLDGIDNLSQNGRITSFN